VDWRLFWRCVVSFTLPFVLACAIAPAIAQPVAQGVEEIKADPQEAARLRANAEAGERVRARIAAATAALAASPTFKALSPKDRQAIMEFVSGNVLFVMLHELGHAIIGEMGIQVLGKDEDAADSYAAVRLIRIGSDYLDRVVANAAKGWFMADRRDQKDGETVPYYDAHSLNQQRAYQFVCFLVGSNEEKFKNLADETKLPKVRRESCEEDYRKALNAWDAVLNPHLRAPAQPKTRIDVIYGEGKGKLEFVAQAVRAIQILEPVAERMSDLFVWPAPFTLEMQTCGFVNAAWMPSERKLVVCYELAHDFAELYRAYGDLESRKVASRKTKTPTIHRAGRRQASGQGFR
jgi:hypothetical protein